jgi:hypothetical protein
MKPDLDIPTVVRSPTQQRGKSFTRRELSDYYRKQYNASYTERTLAKKASTGEDGPPFYYLGRYPRYPKDLADAWIRKKISRLVRSAAEGKAQIAAQHPIAA